MESLLNPNLLTGTRDFSGTWNLSNATKESEKYNGLTVMSKTTNFAGVYQEIKLEPGIYTFSCFARADTPANTFQMFIVANNDDLDKTEPSYLGNVSVTNVFQRLIMIFELKETYFVRPRFEKNGNSAESNKLYVCGHKLERGENHNPIWTPAPEDFTAIYDRLAALEGKVNPA